MVTCRTMHQDDGAPRFARAGIGFCQEKKRLLDQFLDAIHELNELQSQQIQAVIDGDSDFGRFDDLLHLAQERKERSKYEWIAHVEAHQCDEGGR